MWQFFVLLYWILKITLQRVRYGNAYPERLTSSSHDWKMVIWGLTLTYVSSIVYGHSIFPQDLQIKTSLTSSNNERIWLLIDCPNQRAGNHMKATKNPKSVSWTKAEACDIFNVFQTIKRNKKAKKCPFLRIIKAVVLHKGWFCHRGTFGNVWRHARLSQLGALLKSSG